MKQDKQTQRALTKDFCALHLSRRDLITFSEGRLSEEDVLKYTDADMEHMAFRISDTEVFEQWVECVQRFIEDWLIPEKKEQAKTKEGSH